MSDVIAIPLYDKGKKPKVSDTFGYVELYNFDFCVDESQFHPDSSEGFTITNRNLFAFPTGNLWSQTEKDFGPFLSTSGVGGSDVVVGKVTNCYIYIFRRFYDAKPTFYDEYYADKVGIYENFDVTDSRKSNGNKYNKICIHFVDNYRDYQYYFMVSPFRLSYPRINKVLEYIDARSADELSSVFSSCTIEDFSTGNFGEGFRYHKSTLQLLATDYLGYAMKLFSTLEKRLEDASVGAIPPSLQDKKILLLSEMIKTGLKSIDNPDDCILNWTWDQYDVVEKSFAYSTSHGIGSSWKMDTQDLSGNSLTSCPGGKPFPYHEKKDYVVWRNEYENRIQYLQAQVELCANTLILWMQTPGFGFALGNLVYGSFSGAGAKPTTVHFPKVYQMGNVKQQLYTPDYFSPKDGGDLL